MKRFLQMVMMLAPACLLMEARAWPSSGQHRSWKQYGGSADQSKFVEFQGITKDNVKDLKPVWVYPASNGNASMFNPIVVDDVMYVLGNNNSLVALDATTGKEIWIHANLQGIIRRGINYWESKDRKDRRLIFCMQDTLQAIDAVTGKSIMDFGEKGIVSLKEGLGRDPATLRRVQSTTPGAIYDDLILLGSSPGENFMSAPGHLRAYHVVTGKLVWTFHTIPQPGEHGHETWPEDAWKYAGGVNAWGEISVDEKRGIAYFPLGSPTYDYYGADRQGMNLYGNCLLALDARTGERLWHYQTVHHDLWDYDLCAAPQLVTVTRGGKRIDVVAQAGKQGFLFVLDRLTGEPLWPIDERPVPKSQMPGEQSWPTQPFPTVPPPFNRQTVTEEELNPLLPEADKKAWKERLAAARTGLFEPLSDQHETFAMPGATGGANFGNTAANPAAGIVYVTAQEFPSVFKLRKEPAIGSRQDFTPPPADQMARAKAEYARNCQGCHGESGGGNGSIPSLSNLGARIPLENFKLMVATGTGQMPGFPHLDESTVSGIYTFLKGATVAGDASRPSPSPPQPALEKPQRKDGPVVASGGARGDVPVPPLPRSGGSDGKRYPEGVTPPENHYTTGYGLEHPNMLRPPWSIIAAYDLNKGTLLWKRPLGHDPKFPMEGKGLGIPNGSQRKGMIVTSTGLVFASCKDGKIYAYDAADGEILWSVQLPRNPEGLLTMYESGGCQYLAVVSMDFVINKDANPDPVSGYHIFALPEKK